MMLVDTSIWIDHLRRSEARLLAALEAGEVLMHPFVVGELACGNLRNRRELLDLLANLPTAPMAADAEVLQYIERRKLMGRGIGFLDAHLLAATALGAPARLWTRDRRLSVIATELGLGFTR
jgi:predicted nucleic acid-binding protein